MRWLLAGGLLLGLLFPVSYAQPCEFHPVPSFDRGLVKVEQFGTSGLMAFYYDADGDGRPDRALLFQIGTDGNFIQWPLFYMEQLDEYGAAQEVWVDTRGNGECSSMQLYWKRAL